MKAALSLTLALALMTSALPVTAQEGIDRTAGPIGRAIMRETVRLAAEPAVEAAQQAGESTNAEWSRVRKLKRGTEIIVTANGSHPGELRLVRRRVRHHDTEPGRSDAASPRTRGLASCGRA
jgi:hypothetical protein